MGQKGAGLVCSLICLGLFQGPATGADRDWRVMYSSRVGQARVSDRIEEFLEEGASRDTQVGWLEVGAGVLEASCPLQREHACR